MGLIGLAIRSLLGSPDAHQPRKTGGCCNHRQNQQAYLTQPQPQYIAAGPNYMNTNMNMGRPSCHQRKRERRCQRQFQRAERSQLRAEQRAERDFQKAERRQAGVMMVKSGAQRIGIMDGRSNNENVRETRDLHEPRDGVYEMDAINQQDAPPVYEEVEKKK
ncbi:hypothetical protein FSARC_2180 [Fusarium sarcochroum]|uniref:Uncharacterized protein n=1 Tax=Fusarium sarcochroum TaxID=1208366 RepID=A0A8H4XE11_9HYPO|nr:hypothetical protein FSARC_2180 [Fusarium sarcochroum]